MTEVMEPNQNGAEDKRENKKRHDRGERTATKERSERRQRRTEGKE